MTLFNVFRAENHLHIEIKSVGTGQEWVAMGTKCFIEVGVFSLELLAYQVSMVCAANWPRWLFLLKTELLILDFQHFHWLAGHRLSAHIPALPNMVSERINKESWIRIFPRNRQPWTKKNRLAAELTSRNSGTGPKSKWNLPLHCSECFRMTKTSAIIVIKKFFS